MDLIFMKKMFVAVNWVCGIAPRQTGGKSVRVAACAAMNCCKKRCKKCFV